MDSVMDMDVVLLAWATAMTLLLYKTNSFRTSIATTVVVLAFLVASLMHIFMNNMYDMFIIAAAASVLVFRVIPYDTIDKWKKKSRCC